MQYVQICQGHGRTTRQESSSEVRPEPRHSQSGLARIQAAARLQDVVAWRHVAGVPPCHNSRTYPCCGYSSKDNRQTQTKFLCVDCGYENHADVVGAFNVLERG